MVTEIKTGREAILFLGKQMYGENFNLENENVFRSYEAVYSYMVKRSNLKCKKGILLIGGLGVGKSAMMKVMQRLFKDTESRFKWINSYDLKDLSETYTTAKIKEIYGFDLKMDLYIDDIGISVDVKRFGNTVNIITEILMERYDLFISSGYKTHISSNLVTQITNDLHNTPTLKSVYGARLVDRLREMCEIITFKGESQRK